MGLNEGMLHSSRGKLAVGTVALDWLSPYPQALRRVSAAGHASHITRHTSHITHHASRAHTSATLVQALTVGPTVKPSPRLSRMRFMLSALEREKGGGGLMLT